MKRRTLLATLGGALAAGCTAQPTSQNTATTTTDAKTRTTTEPAGETTKQTAETTEQTTAETEPYPESIASVQEGVADGWYTQAYDSNRSRYNSGGAGPDSKPERQYEISERWSQVVHDGGYYREISDEYYATHLKRFDIESRDVTRLGDGKGKPAALHDGVLYCSSIQSLSAFNLDDGEYAWTYEPDIQSKYINVAGYDDSIVVLFTNHAAMLDTSGDDVNEEWRVTPDAPDEFDSAWFLDDSLVIRDSDTNYHVVRLDDGDVVSETSDLPRRIPVSKLPGVTIDQPLRHLDVSNGQLAYTPQVAVYGNRSRVELRSLETLDQKWENTDGGYVYAIADNTVYVGLNEYVRALDAETGMEQWRVELEEGSRFRAVIPTNDSLLVQRRSKTVVFA